MRVIAGLYRRRQLVSPRGLATRPTSDRLRETLFNILSPLIPGCRFADLYAGTGAVGIEAISRGAAHVFFAEKAPPAVTALRENLKSLKIAGGYSLDDRGTGALLARLGESSAPGKLDLVFLDPPYELESEYIATLGLLGSRRGQTMLAPGAQVIAEHSRQFALPERFGHLERTRVVPQGDATLSFFSVAQPASPPPPVEPA